jgi:hypothetical protein
MPLLSPQRGTKPVLIELLGASSKLLVFVFEQDATNLRLPISELKLTQYPARSPLPIAALPSVSSIPSARLPILKRLGDLLGIYSSSFLRF